MYTVGLYTLGCKVSAYETEAVAEAFERAGFTVGSFSEVCDVYVINTCTVTAESDAKSRKYIRRAVRQNPCGVVIVMGCFGQRSPGEVFSIPGVSAVLGTADKMTAPDIALDILRGGSRRVSVSSLEGAAFEPMTIERAPRTRAYVKIEDGCECRCSYCAIAPARGPVRSKLPDEVIREVEGLCAGGTREIVLTGIEVGSYGSDLGGSVSLASLIEELDRRHSCERVRLGSMAPELMSADFVTRVGALPIMVPHFHISMQSGSDSVLRAMRRRYNRRMAMESIKRIREIMPRVMLTADLMVGFPGEREEDFLDTVSFVREARLLDAHVFAYSRRSGTPAAEYDGQIPEEVKRCRSAALIAEVAAVRDSVLDGVVAEGQPLSCILEDGRDGCFNAHSDSYIEVVCDGEGYSSGEAALVNPESHKNGIVYGKILGYDK